ncbi:hypothetical protein CASFOL_021603 [Castilleja foliolosa]|uniref:CRAL-TRIO domain-containing protein n=1 Tax=Castilleja foliolosa TaxID=1961234 RepID=A0ABD3CZP8_9LAMI
MIFRIKQDYQKHHSQKLFTRLLVFTIEVAIQTMAKNVHQFVILFDGSHFRRSSSALINMLVATLKIIADNYPLRLHKAFIIDPPSLFSYLWKGVRPFVELSPSTTFISSFDYEESFQFNNIMASSYSRTPSRRFDQSSKPSTAKLGSCSSSRFTFTVSHHFDTLKPWYLSLTDTSKVKSGRANNIPHAFLGPNISPLNARSLSFSSPMPQKTQKPDPSMIRQTRTPKPSFLHSPAIFFRKEYHPHGPDQKSYESFIPFLKLYRQPYDEMIYRSKMRPPLGGLVPIVSPRFKRRHISRSQRF